MSDLPQPIQENPDMLLCSRTEFLELPELFQEMGKKFIEKGFLFSVEDRPTIGSRPSGHSHEGTVAIGHDSRGDEWEVNYGTANAVDGWNNYHDIGEQVHFFLKGREGVEYETVRGNTGEIASFASGIRVSEW